MSTQSSKVGSVGENSIGCSGSGESKGKGTLPGFVSSEPRQTTLNSTYKKDLQVDVKRRVGHFIYSAALPFNVMNDPYWLPMAWAWASAEQSVKSHAVPSMIRDRLGHTVRNGPTGFGSYLVRSTHRSSCVSALLLQEKLTLAEVCAAAVPLSLSALRSHLMAVLQFFPPSSPVVSAKLHAVVLFNICDCYVRRPDQADRVIGTLLGSVSDGVIEIKNSYAVPHNESADQVALDVDYHRNMYLSHLKVNPKEVLVGWFSTGFGVSGGSALIHEFYVKELKEAQSSIPPIHLTVDTGFKNGEASIKGYVSSNLSLGDRPLAAQFQEIPLDLRMIEAERVGCTNLDLSSLNILHLFFSNAISTVLEHGTMRIDFEAADSCPLYVDILKTTVVDKLPNDLEGMEASMERLHSLLDEIYKYVGDVVEGRVAPDNDIGRFLADTLASVPRMSPAAFDKVFNDKIQDNLALVYLSSLVKTQLGIAEKLNTAAQIL
ncbi:hypothetical protein ZIOFF_066824 [Zingiber officinale]|uniref:Eukaryotic translation initiation factor 3 subunit F n=1 Tax=Zingiber officinale TaxID=94328 RepID=A0A8J5KI25_ZINOF|nr:hypothetical protein ZIOFF_066824 [Zingiber officinale]